MITKSIERAQKKVEENNFGIRKRLLEYDDVMNAQREVIYKRRRNALYGDRIRTDIANMFYELVEAHVLATHPVKDFDGSAWRSSRTLASSRRSTRTPSAQASRGPRAPDLPACRAALPGQARRPRENAHPVIQRARRREERLQEHPRAVQRRPQNLASRRGHRAERLTKAKACSTPEKAVVLAIIDQHWKEHLRDMDDLRSNVQHARFEQKDPLLIYKFESYELFQKLVQKVNAQVASFLMKCTIPTGCRPTPPSARPSAAPRVQEQKAGVANTAEQALLPAAAPKAACQAAHRCRPSRAIAPGRPLSSACHVRNQCLPFGRKEDWSERDGHHPQRRRSPNPEVQEGRAVAQPGLAAAGS